MNPGRVQELVTKAFVLEATTDKPGCTTRYEDLPGKPLQDFMMAGINSAPAFALFARARIADPDAPVFGQNLMALQVSNRHKSDKFLNFGLLEIMFPAVAARLECDDPEQVVSRVVDVVKNTGNEDVQNVLATRALAWTTSGTASKISFKPQKYEELGSVWKFYLALKRDYPPTDSGHQWAEQYKQGLPIMRAFFDGYQDSGELIAATPKIFSAQREEHPEVKLGIHADMCAAAMFLWLSYNDGPV